MQHRTAVDAVFPRGLQKKSREKESRKIFNSALLRLDTKPVRSLLRAVTADCHAAPSPRAPPRMIGEEKCAGRSLAGFHPRKILRADEPRQGLTDRKEERFG